MGATFVSIEVEKIRAGAKFSAAYDLPWWFLRQTLKDFAPNTEIPVRNYLDEYASKEGQTAYLKGKRPYSQREFTYNFPDCAGLCSQAAQLAKHWLKLAVAIWQSEVEGYFERDGVRLASQFPAIREIVESGRFVFLRNATWSVSSEADESITLYNQGVQEGESLSFTWLNSGEQEIVTNMLASGRCGCEICRMITPSPDSIHRLKEELSKQQDFHGVQRLGLWIAALVFPSPEVIRMLLDAVPRLTAESSPTYAGQFRPAKAFYLLCRRSPKVFDTLQEGLSSEDDWVRAIVISGLKAQLATGRASYVDHIETINKALITSLPEAYCAMDLLSEAPIPAQLHEALYQQMLESLKRFGEADSPGAQLNSLAFKTWKQWFEPLDTLPHLIKQYCQKFLQRIPAGHFSAEHARKLLDVCAR